MLIQIYVFSTATIHNLCLCFIGFANETVKAQGGWLTNLKVTEQGSWNTGTELKTALQQPSSHRSSPSSTVHPLEMISWTPFVLVLTWDRRKVLSVSVASPFSGLTALWWVPTSCSAPFRLLQSPTSFGKSEIKLIPFQTRQSLPVTFLSRSGGTQASE